MSYSPAEHRPTKVTEWHVSPELAAYTATEFKQVNLPRALDRFTRHHKGRATRSSSWDAEFLNWLQQDADKIGQHSEDGTDYRGVPNNTAREWDNYLMGRDR